MCHIAWPNVINIQEKEEFLEIFTMQRLGGYIQREYRGLVHFINSPTSLKSKIPHQRLEFTNNQGTQVHEKKIQGNQIHHSQDFGWNHSVFKGDPLNYILYK